MDNAKQYLVGLGLDPQSADPSNPVEGDIQFADGTARTKGVYVFKDSVWSEIGAGGSGGGLDIFYKEDFETTVDASSLTSGNNATFDNGGTLDGALADDTTTEIAGEKSVKYTMGSSSTNDWFASPTILIDEKQQEGVIGLTFYYTYDGADDDIKIVLFDDTNNVVLNAATDFIKASSGATRATVQGFVPNGVGNLKWGFQVVTGNSGKILKIDDIEMTTSPFVSSNFIVQSFETNILSADVTSDTTTIADLTFTNLIVGNIYTVGGVCNMTDAASAAEASEFFMQNGAQQFRIGHKHNASSDVADQVAVGINIIFEATATTVTFDFLEASAGILHGDGTKDETFVTLESLTLTENIIAYSPLTATNSMVRMNTFNGFGSTNTLIRKWLNTSTEGTAITLNNSATLGAELTVNETGVYHVTYTDQFGAAANFGITLNADVTLNILNVPAGDTLAQDNTPSVGQPVSTSWAGILTKGDIVRFQTDSGNTGGTAGRSMATMSKIGSSELVGIPRNLIGYVYEEQTGGTDGGTFTTGALRTRTLNTTSGEFAKFGTISSNQITLAAGIYHIDAVVPAQGVNEHQAILRNITDSTTDIEGSSEYSADSDITSTNCMIVGTITITTAKVFEIQHRGSVTEATVGFGNSSTFAVNEIYTRVKITKIA